MRNDKTRYIAQNLTMSVPWGKQLQQTVLGPRLRARREVLGLTQEQLGVAIGLDESCGKTRISRYEGGVHEPPLQTSKQLAEALSVPLPYLFCGDEITAEIILLTDRLDLTGKQMLLESAKKILISITEGNVKQCPVCKQLNTQLPE